MFANAALLAILAALLLVLFIPGGRGFRLLKRHARKEPSTSVAGSPLIEKIGPFAAAFEKGGLAVPGYLELLHLKGAGANVVIGRIETALRRDDARSYISALFQDPNWRLHLVGAIALLLIDNAVAESGLAWQAIDRGSWVAPQIIVALYFADPEFRRHALARIDARCAIHVPANLSAIERHSATGPAGSEQRSAKLLAALLSIASLDENLYLLHDHASAYEAELLKHDLDNSGRITTSWLQHVTAKFTDQGRPLKPRSL